MSPMLAATACQRFCGSWRLTMKTRAALVGRLLVFAGVLGLSSIGQHAVAALSPATTLQALDTDHDGTVDLNEVRTAASSLFDRLDRDHDGTLDRRELKGRLGAKAFAVGDPD